MRAVVRAIRDRLRMTVTRRRGLVVVVVSVVSATTVLLAAPRLLSTDGSVAMTPAAPLVTPSVTPSALPTTAPPVPGVAPAPSRAPAVLAAAVSTDAPDEYGTAVLDLVTGATELGPAALRPMYSASLAKLIVAVDVMGRRSELAVTPADLDRLRRSLSTSDDGAMSALWDRFDGYGAVGRVSLRYGLTATAPPSPPGEWGSVLISARDVAVLYWVISTQLDPADSRLVLDALNSATPRAADGFDQDFGLLAVGAQSTKQGWACCYSGVRVLHSAGVVGGRYVLVLLSSRVGASYQQQRAALDAAARAAVRAAA